LEKEIEEEEEQFDTVFGTFAQLRHKYIEQQEYVMKLKEEASLKDEEARNKIRAKDDEIEQLKRELEELKAGRQGSM